MDLVCPTCDFTQRRTFVSVRLPTCPRCEREGKSSYLVPAEEPRRPERRRRRWRRSPETGSGLSGR